ncbi:MAG TPA: 4a-hydroxytetrahydrobiopterin dehydratase [Chitinivibrionales bacterium]|nr:4a-hydroxytetrahydrobiopterin dehydratase [Chitinivibrionales bacterium]
MNLNNEHCTPIAAGSAPLSDRDEDEYLESVAGWDLVRETPHKIKREIKFGTYMDGADFAHEVAAIADAENHHPAMHVYYKKVVIELYTHSVEGLSKNDFIIAAKVNNAL